MRETVSENWFAFLLIIPTILFLVLLMWIPFVRGIVMTLYNWPFGGHPKWVGLGNYDYIFHWGAFYQGLEATIIFAFTTVIQLAVALAAALAVRRLKRFGNIVTGIFLIAYTVPPLITGTLWKYLFDPDLGPFFSLLTQWGILDKTVYWGTSGDTAMAVVMFVTVWTFWPFMFIILSANLQNIPDELYESARIYGASQTQMFRKITLPQLKSAIVVVISIRLIWNLTKVSQVLQLTNGGPGYDTSVLAVLLYRLAYGRGALGQAYTVGLILFVITIGFAFLFIREFEHSGGGA